MTAIFRLSGSLKDVTGGQDQYTVETDRSVRETLIALGIEPLTVALVVVNKVHENKDYVIQDGDDILVMSVVGGG